MDLRQRLNNQAKNVRQILRTLEKFELQIAKDEAKLAKARKKTVATREGCDCSAQEGVLLAALATADQEWQDYVNAVAVTQAAYGELQDCLRNCE